MVQLARQVQQLSKMLAAPAAWRKSSLYTLAEQVEAICFDTALDEPTQRLLIVRALHRELVRQLDQAEQRLPQLIEPRTLAAQLGGRLEEIAIEQAVAATHESAYAPAIVYALMEQAIRALGELAGEQLSQAELLEL